MTSCWLNRQACIRGRSGKIARPIISRIAYYYNHATAGAPSIIISQSIACGPTILNVKKQKRLFGFLEVYNVF